MNVPKRKRRFLGELKDPVSAPMLFPYGVGVPATHTQDLMFLKPSKGTAAVVRAAEQMRTQTQRD